MDPPHNPTPDSSAFRVGTLNDWGRNMEHVFIDQFNDRYAAGDCPPTSPPLDYAGTDLQQSQYESLSTGADLDSSETLENESTQSSHTGLINLAEPDLPLPTPNYFKDLARSTLASPAAVIAPPNQTPNGSGGGPRTCTSHALSADRNLEQLIRIRKKNREAATKFRQRQRDLGSSLEAKITELSYEQTDLLGKRDSLQYEATALMSQLNALQCITAACPPVVLASPDLPSFGPLLQSGYDVGDGDLLAGNLEASVAAADVGLSDLAVPQNFLINDLAVLTPNEYGYYTSPDPVNDVMRDDQS